MSFTTSDGIGLIPHAMKPNFPSGHMLRSMENFVQWTPKELAKNRQKFHIRVHDSPNTYHEVELSIKDDAQFTKPATPKPFEEEEQLFPAPQAIGNNTYASTCHFTIVMVISTHEDNGTVVTPPITINVKTSIEIPAMVHSVLCSLNGMPRETWPTVGCDIMSPGGGFIVHGLTKIMVPRGTKRFNTTLFYGKKDAKTKKTADHNFDVTATVLSVPADSPYCDNMDNFYVGLSANTGCLVVNHERGIKGVHIRLLFRALGFSDNDIQMAIAGPPENDPRMTALLAPSLDPETTNTPQVMSQADALNILGKSVMPAHQADNEDVNFAAKFATTLLQRLLIHCSESQKPFYLAYMARGILRVSLGATPSDRDSWVNTAIHTPGIYFGQKIFGMINSVIRGLETNLRKELGPRKVLRQGELQSTMARLVNNQTSPIGTQLTNALAAGRWVTAFRVTRTSANITTASVEHATAYSHLSSVSHVRRVKKPMVAATTKQREPRRVSGSQIGFIDVSETPEGQEAGLSSNLGITATITTAIGVAEPIHEFINTHDECRPIEDVPIEDITQLTRIFINGAPIACTSEPVKLFNEAVAMRRGGEFHPHTGIIPDSEDNTIFFDTSPGRLVRPLIIVDNNVPRMTHELAQMVINNEVSWEDLMVDSFSPTGRAVVEYMSAEEVAAYALISQQPELCVPGIRDESGVPKHYTHSEIHGSAIFGAASSLIPCSNREPPARLTYQASMGKQAFGIPAGNLVQQMETNSYILVYPETPLASTVTQQIVSEGFGTVVNLTCAIMTGRRNQEDSIVALNCDSLMMGLVGHTTSVVGKKTTERFTQPTENVTHRRQDADYSKLLPTGTIRPGSHVNTSTIIIGRIIRNDSSSMDGNRTGWRDFSKKSSTSGTATLVNTGRDSQGFQYARVTVLSPAPLRQGDKITARHGQKGVVGESKHRWCMPYDATGRVADILLNPHAYPSRETASMALEGMLGLLAVQEGNVQDATPFSGVTTREIVERISENGDPDVGMTQMYDGQTGFPLPNKIAVLPFAYHKLKHRASEKEHARRTGPSEVPTHQPTEGRQRDGGLRLGEMERDCILSLNLEMFLHAKFMQNSDGYLFYVCQRCGKIAVCNTRENLRQCTTCETGNYILPVHMPYAAKLIAQEASPIGISMSLVLRN